MPSPADADTPSPTTPEGFYFTSKLTLASYNKKQLERQLGLNPAAHEYGFDEEEWLHGAPDSDEDDEGGQGASARALADAEAKDNDARVERLLKEVMELHKVAMAAAGHKEHQLLSAALPPRASPARC